MYILHNKKYVYIYACENFFSLESDTWVVLPPYGMWINYKYQKKIKIKIKNQKKKNGKIYTKIFKERWEIINQNETSFLGQLQIY